MIYAVIESVGNFSHTLEALVASDQRFDNEDEASEFIMTRATESARAEFHFANVEDIPEVEYEEELELALSYYAIEERSD